MTPRDKDWYRPAAVGISALLFSLALVAVLLDRSEPAKGTRPKADDPLVVSTITVRPQPLKAEARATGLLQPVKDVTLFAETHGQVAKRPIREDQPVRRGDLILRLDDTYKKTARASAQAALDEARSVAALRRSQSRRARELARASAISAEELERQLSEEAVAQAALEVAKQRLREAAEDLEKTVIRSPMDGTVVELPFEPFEFVKAGEPVARIIDSSELKLVVEVADRERVGLREGTQASIWVDALPGRAFTGFAFRLGQAAAAPTKKFPVEIRLDNRDRLLLPGMVAEASLPLNAEREAIVVPKEIVMESFGQHYVYLARNNGGSLRAERRPIAVRTIPFLPTHLEVLAGLEAGDRVIGSSLRELREGAIVRVQPLPGAS